MKPITSKQIKDIKKNLDKMKDSDEQFFFMIFKKKNGEDNITQFSYNIPLDKIGFYFKEAINSGTILE